MSYVSFLGEGVYGQQEEFRRTTYPKDHIQSIGTSNTYTGAITVIPATKEKVKEVVIDQAVKVITVSDSLRENAKDFWRGLKDACFGTFTGTLIVSIGAGVGAAILGGLMPPLWPVAVAVGVVALGILGFSIWNVCRGAQANEELSLWDDPLPNYSQVRVKAGQEGFYYAFSNGLKGKYLSDEELKALWFKTMDKWVESYDAHIPSDSVKLSAIRKFMEESPLKDQAMDYTFTAQAGVDPKEMEVLKTLSNKYSGLKSGYDSIRHQTESLKKKIQKEKTTKLLQNDHWMHTCIAPYEALLHAQKMDLILQQTAYNQTIIAYESSIRAYQTHTCHTYQTHHHHTHQGSPTLTVGGHVAVGQGHARAAHSYNGHVNVGQPAYIQPQIVPVHVIHARAGLQSINAKLAKLDFIFSSMTAPIRTVHAQNKAKINVWAKSELSKIEVSEDQMLIKFYSPIKALLEAFRNRNEVEEGLDDIETEMEDPLDPQAPDIEEDYETSPFDPSWKEFVVEVDWENSVMKKTEIKHKGNKTTTKQQYL